MAIINLKEPEYLVKPFIEKHIVKEGAPHRHENFYEIEFIISGTGKAKINNFEFDLKFGDFLFITPLDVHSYRMETPITLYNIHFSEYVILSEYQNILFNTQLRYAHFDDTKTIHNLLNLMLAESLENNHFTNNKLNSYLNLIIASFIQTAKIDNIPKETHTIIQDIVRYIRIHITEHLTLSEVAKIFNISPQHLSMLFSKQLGTGFKQYITALRLDLAKNLLAQTDMSVINICFETGFPSIGTFLRSFKINCGMTPSQYREKHSV